MNLAVAKIKKSEISTLMQEEAFKEGWNYSQEDVDFYFDNPRNHIYAIHADKELAGCVILHESLSQIQNKPLRSAGLFLVKDKFRGQKIVGPALWQQAITQNLNNEMFVCFHSVPRVSPFYEKLGFKRTPLVDLYYSLDIKRLNCSTINELAIIAEKEQLKKVNANDFDKIDAYTEQLFPNQSGLGFCEFLHAWMRRPDAMTVAYYEQGEVKGYGIATICKRLHTEGHEEFIYRISPIYAETSAIGIQIVKSLIHYIKQENGQHIELYSLAAVNTEFGRTLNELGFAELGRNYIISNQANSIKQNATILKVVFCSLPFEYPHEVTMSVE